MLRLVTILILMILFSNKSFCQNQSVLNSTTQKSSLPQPRFLHTDSGFYIIETFRKGCKARIESDYFFANEGETAVTETVKITLPPVAEKFIIIHGNLSYNFNYRSYIDTPFAQEDIMQHSIQTRLNVKIKEKYPFAVYFTSRRSNSPFFSNATDASFQFRQTEMLEGIKNDMRVQADQILADKSILLTPAQIYQREKEGLLKDIGSFPASVVKAKADKVFEEKKKQLTNKFDSLYKDYKTKMDKLNALQEKAKQGSAAQKSVEEKEKQLRGNAERIKDSLKNNAKDFAGKYYDEHLKKTDSIAKTTNANINKKKEDLEKLKKEVAESEKKLKLFQKKIVDSVQEVKKQIASITDKNKLNDFLQKKGNSIKELPALQRFLLSVKQIGLGRTWIDYSELTVKNISLNGVNIEMNPGNIYLATAIGKVNYRFRDYIVKGNYAGSNQQVGLVRAGFGKKDKNNFIFTYYSGQKALLNQRSIADSSTVQKISGFSIETRAAINNNNYLIGEYARSTSPAIKGKIFDLTAA